MAGIIGLSTLESLIREIYSYMLPRKSVSPVRDFPPLFTQLVENYLRRNYDNAPYLIRCVGIAMVLYIRRITIFIRYQYTQEMFANI